MGSCVGRCLPQPGRFAPRQDSVCDFSQLVEECSAPDEEDKRNVFVRLFSKRKSRKKRPVLEFVDGIATARLNPYSRLNDGRQAPSASSPAGRDIPLQCLDAGALLAGTATSTPASSLDLEWEHETLPAPAGSWAAWAPRNPPASTESDWSRVSSANSLEWDSAPTPFPELDADTQLLLGEIERLTSKTLMETGRELFS